MKRVRRVLRAVRIRVLWMAIGWAGAFGMGLFGSKLHGLAGDIAAWFQSRLYALRLWWGAWITWQGASREERQRMREEDEQLGDRFDWLPDMRSER